MVLTAGLCHLKHRGTVRCAQALAQVPCLFLCPFELGQFSTLKSLSVTSALGALLHLQHIFRWEGGSRERPVCWRKALGKTFGSLPKPFSRQFPPVCLWETEALGYR